MGVVIGDQGIGFGTVGFGLKGVPTGVVGLVVIGDLGTEFETTGFGLIGVPTGVVGLIVIGPTSPVRELHIGVILVLEIGFFKGVTFWVGVVLLVLLPMLGKEVLLATGIEVYGEIGYFGLIAGMGILIMGIFFYYPWVTIEITIVISSSFPPIAFLPYFHASIVKGD